MEDSSGEGEGLFAVFVLIDRSVEVGLDLKNACRRLPVLGFEARRWKRGLESVQHKSNWCTVHRGRKTVGDIHAEGYVHRTLHDVRSGQVFYL